MSNTCTLDVPRPGAPAGSPPHPAHACGSTGRDRSGWGHPLQTGAAVAPLPALGPLGPQLLNCRFPLTVRYPVRRVLPVLRVLPIGLVWSGGSLVRLGFRLRSGTVLAGGLRGIRG